MIKRYHRFFLGRCAWCEKRLRHDVPNVRGYEWRGWFRSEWGIYHPACLNKQIEIESRRPDVLNFWGYVQQVPRLRVVR